MEHFSSKYVTQAKLDVLETWFKLDAHNRLLYAAGHNSVKNGFREENEPFKGEFININSSVIDLNDYSKYAQLRRYVKSKLQSHREAINYNPVYPIKSRRGCSDMDSFIGVMEVKASELAMFQDGKRASESMYEIVDANYIYRTSKAPSTEEPVFENAVTFKVIETDLFSKLVIQLSGNVMPSSVTYKELDSSVERLLPHTGACKVCWYLGLDSKGTSPGTGLIIDTKTGMPILGLNKGANASKDVNLGPNVDPINVPHRVLIKLLAAIKSSFTLKYSGTFQEHLISRVKALYKPGSVKELQWDNQIQNIINFARGKLKRTTNEVLKRIDKELDLKHIFPEINMAILNALLEEGIVIAPQFEVPALPKVASTSKEVHDPIADDTDSIEDLAQLLGLDSLGPNARHKCKWEKSKRRIDAWCKAGATANQIREGLIKVATPEAEMPAESALLTYLAKKRKEFGISKS